MRTASPCASASPRPDTAASVSPDAAAATAVAPPSYERRGEGRVGLGAEAEGATSQIEPAPELATVTEPAFAFSTSCSSR